MNVPMAPHEPDQRFAEALERFRELLDRAGKTALSEPAAMTLATVAPGGRPAARVVLLRGFDERGFVFYTNTLSDKGKQLAENGHVALCFYWDELAEQVRIDGVAEQVSDEEADAYWRTRPRERQLGAWASIQSQPLDSRRTLVDRFAEYQQQYAGRQVPRPPFWSGYRVTAHRIEFWNSQPARLHERVVYERRGDRWTKRLLYP